MRRLILLASLSFVPSLAFSQRLFSYGWKGGVPLTDAISGSRSKNYVIGPMVELNLPLGFSIEADALYRPLNFTTAPSSGRIISDDIGSAEFPILVKYHFLHTPIVKPYAEAGPMFRHVGSTASYLSGRGFALGGGIDFKLLVVKISPELRFSRWGSDSIPTIATFPSSNRNQAEFLIGLAF
jgi:hypothetical protein